MSDTKPATERQKYLDERIAEAEGIADKANQSLQERDSAAAQKAQQEKAGVGEDNTQKNKSPLLEMARKRLAIAVEKGDKAKAEQIRAQIKELEAM